MRRVGASAAECGNVDIELKKNGTVIGDLYCLQLENIFRRISVSVLNCFITQ